MTNNLKNPRGAGRKAGVKFVDESARKKSRNLSMDDARWEKFLALGGSKWLAKVIDAS